MTIEPQPAPKPRIRLLYAEDEPGVALITKAMLEGMGFEVEHAPDGRRALEMFNANASRYDAVLTDDAMPHFTGLQLTEQLCASGFAGHVVVYSGVVDTAKARAYRALGVSAIVHKLDPLEHLINALRAAARPGPNPAPSSSPSPA